MHINIDDLKPYDTIIFARYIKKEVRRVYSGGGDLVRAVGFSDGTSLVRSDSLWELAELQKPRVPCTLWLADLNHNDRYVLNQGPSDYTPSDLLRLLRRDVELLEKAGV